MRPLCFRGVSVGGLLEMAKKMSPTGPAAAVAPCAAARAIPSRTRAPRNPEIMVLVVAVRIEHCGDLVRTAAKDIAAHPVSRSRTRACRVLCSAVQKARAQQAPGAKVHVHRLPTAAEEASVEGLLAARSLRGASESTRVWSRMWRDGAPSRAVPWRRPRRWWSCSC